MKNAREMRTELVSVFNDLRSGKIEAKEASELNKTANVIMKGVGQQLRYRKDRKEKPQIGFMDCK